MKIFIGGAYTDENGQAYKPPYKPEGQSSKSRKRLQQLDGAADEEDLLEQLEDLHI